MSHPKPTYLTAGQFRAEHVDQVEHDLQKRCLTWFRLAYPQLLLIGIPNAAKRTRAERGRLLSEGLTKGIPDLLLAYPAGEHHALWIEMKTVNGRPSNAQIKIQAHLRALGYAVIMPRTFDEFQQQVNEYLNQSTL